MNAVRILSASLIMLALLPTMGCGIVATNKAIKEEKQKDDLKKEGNAALDNYRSEKNAIYAEYGIDLNSVFDYGPNTTWSSTVSKFEWCKFSPTTRATIRTRLKNFRSNVGRIYEIANHKGMKWDGWGSTTGYRTASENAGYFLTAMTSHEATPTSTCAATR